MSLPFRLPDIYGGLAEASGLLRDEGEHIVIEYCVKDGLFGIKGQTQEVRVHVNEVCELNLTDGWFGGGKLTLRCVRHQPVESIPTSDQGKVIFKIAKADIPTARAFVAGQHLAK